VRSVEDADADEVARGEDVDREALRDDDGDRDGDMMIGVGVGAGVDRLDLDVLFAFLLHLT
jgi:hypothetical protein